MLLEQTSVTWLKMGPFLSPGPPSSPLCLEGLHTGTSCIPGRAARICPHHSQVSFSPAASCEGLSDSGLEALGLEAAGPGKPVWGYHRTRELPEYILPPHPRPAGPFYGSAHRDHDMTVVWRLSLQVLDFLWN